MQPWFGVCLTRRLLHDYREIQNRRWNGSCLGPETSPESPAIEQFGGSLADHLAGCLGELACCIWRESGGDVAADMASAVQESECECPRLVSRRLSARSACHPTPLCSPSQPFYSSSQPLCSLVAPSLLAITSNHALHMSMQDSSGTSSLPSLPVCASNNLPQPTPCPMIGDLLSALSKHAELANMSYSALDIFIHCANQLKNDILLPQPQSISHLEPLLVLPPSIAGFLANVSGISPALVDCLWVIVQNLVWSLPLQDQEDLWQEEVFERYEHLLVIGMSILPFCIYFSCLFICSSSHILFSNRLLHKL